jgi:hypothetical protein
MHSLYCEGIREISFHFESSWGYSLHMQHCKKVLKVRVYFLIGYFSSDIPGGFSCQEDYLSC